MSRVIRSTSRPYDRAQVMQWLADRCCWPGDCPDFTDETPSGRAAVIDLLRKVCTAMRGAGIRGAWYYSLPLHTELLRILKSEEAQLAALQAQLAAQRGSRNLSATSCAGGKGGRPRARVKRASWVPSPPREALTQARRLSHGSG